MNVNVQQTHTSDSNLYGGDVSWLYYGTSFLFYFTLGVLHSQQWTCLFRHLDVYFICLGGTVYVIGNINKWLLKVNKPDYSLGHFCQAAESFNYCHSRSRSSCSPPITVGNALTASVSCPIPLCQLTLRRLDPAVPQNKNSKEVISCVFPTIQRRWSGNRVWVSTQDRTVHGKIMNCSVLPVTSCIISVCTVRSMRMRMMNVMHISAHWLL